VQRYLLAEIECVRERITPEDRILELGCGYGRVLQHIAPPARVVGIDTAFDSLSLAKDVVPYPASTFFQMDASMLGFSNQSFDVVICIQNGISALKVDPKALLQEACRVTRPGGRMLFSSYSEKFWDDRLEWFRIQARHGLIGEIDAHRSGGGTIVCKDGFTATTASPDQFRSLSSSLGLAADIFEVDESSIFCEIIAI
jgi:2-polyprenyl-6-hydroxyphenyl methylase/3-demethylubiquinone-9 3-methyltransferase